MLHMLPGASDFDLRRQFGGTRVGDGLGSRSTYLVEAYTGWPSR